MDATLSFDEHKKQFIFLFVEFIMSNQQPGKTSFRHKHFIKLYQCTGLQQTLLLFFCLVQFDEWDINKLQNVQNFAARIGTRSRKFDHITLGLRELKYLSVESMLVYRHGILAFKCLRGLPSNWPKNLKQRGPNFTAETRVTRTRLTHEICRRPKVFSLSDRSTVELFTRKAHRVNKRCDILQEGTYALCYLKSSQ